MEDRIRELVKEGDEEAILNICRRKWISTDLQTIVRMCETVETLVDEKTGFANITPKWLSIVKTRAESAELDFLKLMEKNGKD